MSKIDIMRRLGEELERAKEKRRMYSEDVSRAGFTLEQHYAGKAEAYHVAIRLLELLDEPSIAG